jgi:hypothetical protein
MMVQSLQVYVPEEHTEEKHSSPFHEYTWDDFLQVQIPEEEHKVKETEWFREYSWNDVDVNPLDQYTLVCKSSGNGRKVIGTVGALQYEVIQYRLEHEYGAKCRFEGMSVTKACWITSEDPKKLQEFVRLKGQNIAQDKDGNYVFLAESDWILRMNQTNNPEIVFHFTSEFKLA